MTRGTVAPERPADSPSMRSAGRSFAITCELLRSTLFELDREIERHHEASRPFPAAVTDILVVDHLGGVDVDAVWPREQVRRGVINRNRWGHPEFATERALRAALAGN